MTPRRPHSDHPVTSFPSQTHHIICASWRCSVQHKEGELSIFSFLFLCENALHDMATTTLWSPSDEFSVTNPSFVRRVVAMQCAAQRGRAYFHSSSSVKAYHIFITEVCSSIGYLSTCNCQSECPFLQKWLSLETVKTRVEIYILWGTSSVS